MYLVVFHSPSQDSQASIVVLIDPLNQKIEHQTIKWDQLSFPSHWVFDTPRVPKQCATTTVNIQEGSSSAIISFPLTISSLLERCLHPYLQPLMCSLGPVPFSVKCQDYCHLISLQSLAAQHGEYCYDHNQTILFEPKHAPHAHHNPRTNISPPTLFGEPFPHPKCVDISFPHDDHVLMIHSIPALEANDPPSKKYLSIFDLLVCLNMG